MSEKFVRAFSIPKDLEEKIDRVLSKNFGLSLSNSREIASSVQQMSDYYIENPKDQTPWAERWCRIAQLAYYFPLNYLRAQAVLTEGNRFGFFNSIDQVVDFGSGLGPTGLAYQNQHSRARVQVIEKSTEAMGLSRELGVEFESIGTSDFSKLNSSPAGIANNVGSRSGADRSKLLSFSYSITELPNYPRWIFDFENLMIIEPSTRDDGRKLLEFRAKLIMEGYAMWAPCPHQQACPLLVNNPHDWCHDRIHFNRPEWWLQMEKHLPFRNQTLTFSYLLASRRPRPETDPQIRLVGDLMKEKGKSRQMICRGPERQFFSWLKRQGDVPEYPRGALMQQPTDLIQASGEFRPQSDLEFVTTRKNAKDASSLE